MSWVRSSLRLLFVSMLLQAMAGAALAQAPARIDAKGGADHPLLSRYAGSWLIAWRKVGFAEVTPLAMLTEDIAKAKKLDPKLSVEGELTELYYVAPKGRTALEVQRNYEDALARAGATLLYSCKGGDWGCHDRGGPATQLLLDRVVPIAQQFDAGGAAYAAFDALSRNLRLAVYRLQRPEGPVHVSVYTVDGNPDDRVFGGAAATYLQIVASRGAEMGQVTVFKAAQLASGLGAEGKVALYGIHFDSGRAELKPESAAQLAEMAALLKAQPALRVFIVGHTDNQGGLEANLALSQQRADAVVAALARQHGVDARRMLARGVASLAPLASNAAEAGRAKNRRVELVAQ